MESPDIFLVTRLVDWEPQLVRRRLCRQVPLVRLGVALLEIEEQLARDAPQQEGRPCG